MPPPSAGERSERESLWSVSAKRLPYYLIVFSLLMGVGLLGSAITAISGGAKFWAVIVKVAQELAAIGAATGGVLLAIEGSIMGITKLIIERTREEAYAQGARQERQRIERHLKEQGVNVQLPDPAEQQKQDKKNP